MIRPLPALLAVWLGASAVFAIAGERIDPAGIKGSLVISGAGLPQPGLEQFYQFAHAEKARVVILFSEASDATKSASTRLVKHWRDSGAASVETLLLDGDADAAVLKNTLATASGVWLLGDGGSWRAALEIGGLRAAMVAVLERDGVIGGSAAATGVFADSGFGFLPGSAITTSPDAQRSPSPSGSERPPLVHYAIDPDAAMFVRGRRLWAAGGGKVQISLPASANREATQIALGAPRSVADLSALRFAARARQAAPFPAEHPPSPEVENGTLIIIGGGGMPDGIIAKFVALAGGEQASIIVLPTANPDPVSERSSIANEFKQAGAKQVTVLPARTLEMVESEEYLQAFRNATGIWFGGGRQWRFADAYLDTQALEAMHQVLERGGVIMGSSAGASIQADYLARANPLGNLDIMAEGYERGLGFIRGVAIDQHFAQRKRFKDMSSLVDRYPQILGIGIDESTALIVTGAVGAVTGKGQVHFYDRNKPTVAGEPDHESVAAGGRYDLVARKVLDTGE